jgi:hypothetical protein
VQERFRGSYSIAKALVTHAETGAVCKHAGSNIHSEKFLEEELCSVRNVNLGNAGFVVTGATFVVAFLDHSKKKVC